MSGGAILPHIRARYLLLCPSAALIVVFSESVRASATKQAAENGHRLPLEDNSILISIASLFLGY